MRCYYKQMFDHLYYTMSFTPTVYISSVYQAVEVVGLLPVSVCRATVRNGSSNDGQLTLSLYRMVARLLLSI